MADKASDIPNAGHSRHATDVDAHIDASADELAELDSLVSSLVDEINDATDEISRVMASDDEDTQTAMAIDSGKASQTSLSAAFRRRKTLWVLAVPPRSARTWRLTWQTIA